MAQNVFQKIIDTHLVEGRTEPGQNVGIRIDQTLTQDATGTLAWLEFEALEIPRVKTEVSVSYVDHNLLQSDFKNADDHRFLRTTAAKYGAMFSPPGNGICHQLHLENFAIPGKTLLGSDSHTPTAGGMGMLAMGAGGLDVAAAMAGQPFFLTMPRVLGVKLTGRLPDWVSAKDVILELLRRRSVKGGLGFVVEYFGDGQKTLTVPQRAMITNMGAELGATTSIFPADGITKNFLEAQGRAGDYAPLEADPGAIYDDLEEIDLGRLEPLMACPSSPDNVRPVSELTGTPVDQVIIGSCAGSSLSDLLLVAATLDGQRVSPRCGLDINPGSREVTLNLAASGAMAILLAAGVRFNQSGCLGCIGMGQAPPTQGVSLRTMPRNFPGRSGTKDDQVYLCSAQTAVASALAGEITDPRILGKMPVKAEPQSRKLCRDTIIDPPRDGRPVEIVRGPNIKPFPRLEALPDDMTLEVTLKVGDNITTDHIMPAGADILPLRSNIEAISAHVYCHLDADCAARSADIEASAVIGGENYGQGSSREHAALAPRYLGVRAKIAKNFARIHRANLINFGVLPLTFALPADYDSLNQGDRIEFRDLRRAVLGGEETIEGRVGERRIGFRLEASDRERQILAAGGLLALIRDQAA